MSDTDVPIGANSDATAAADAMAATLAGGDERLAYRGIFQRLLVRPEIGAIVGAVAIWAFFWAVSKEFGTAGGMSSILDVSATLGIMAVAVSLLMIGGEFDLSSGAATGTFAIITILLVKDVGDLGGGGLSLWVAIPLSLVFALALGWINGTMVERTGLPSFIVTLATFFILRGFKLGFSKLIIDNLTVGRISEASGRGHEFWKPIFATVWIRNEHQFESRDAVYTIGIIGGLALLAFAIAELNFTHRDKQNPAGLAVSGAGIAGVVAGILYMHNSDGVAANTVAAVILAAAGLAAFVGFCMWRYESQSLGTIQLGNSVAPLLATGVVASILAMVSILVFDVESQESVLDLVGFLQWPFVILIGGYAAYRAFKKSETDSNTSSQTAVNVASIGLASGFAVYAFMFMTTEQGLRSILFGLAMLAGLSILAVAAGKAGRNSPISRGLVLTVFSLVLMVLGFFIRSQSESVKFRSELFSVLLATALVVFVWAVCSSMFTQRRFQETTGDNLGTLIAKIGGGAVVIGIVVKLLFTTQAELDAGIPRAGFRVSILWFIGFSLFATWLLGRTKFGSWIFAVGGNKQAARQVGVPAARTKTQLFMIVAVAAWLVGLLLAFRLDTVQSVAGNGLEFEYIIAAVVGGTLLTGGYGSAFGAAIGAVIVAMAKQGIPSARWNSDWRFAFLGLILLAAVIANNFIKTRAEESR
ncbi:MAG: simple sugar transport system permease protein [Verrucomicrobiales bacterium]|jgi:simple sugar transport system permease protein